MDPVIKKKRTMLDMAERLKIADFLTANPKDSSFIRIVCLIGAAWRTKNVKIVKWNFCFAGQTPNNNRGVAIEAYHRGLPIEAEIPSS